MPMVLAHVRPSGPSLGNCNPWDPQYSVLPHSNSHNDCAPKSLQVTPYVQTNPRGESGAEWNAPEADVQARILPRGKL